MHIHQQQIEQLEQRYRTTFINSLAGYRQAVLVGTKSAGGQSNLAIFNSLIHLGANPALLGLISRPAPEGVQRHTLQNILDTGEYTLNYVSAEYMKQAHQTSARYAESESEFQCVGFGEHYLPGFSAPCVEQAVVRIAMQFQQLIPIPLNDTALIVGSITQVQCNGVEVLPDGFVNLEPAQVLISQGLDAYFTGSGVGRLPYAKP
jgi:flavin reductase (DIM6/NTAB) family NADH-FMN oxidoreductase RutF